MSNLASDTRSIAMRIPVWRPPGHAYTYADIPATELLRIHALRLCEQNDELQHAAGLAMTLHAAQLGIEYRQAGTHPGVYKVHVNNVHVGDLAPAEDGIFYFWQERKGGGGYLPAWVLYGIAEKLDAINIEWERKLAQCPKSSPE